MGNYKDSKMETLADKGNGNYAYIVSLLGAVANFVTAYFLIKIIFLAKD
jgi:Ca-activated chloride channel family protein